MSAEENLVIVGASLTGAKAAEAIRETGFDGKVVLLGSEARPPYERPPLSKDYLRGEADEKPFVFDDGFYAERDVELHTGTNVTAIDPETSTVSIDGSPEVSFDRLLIATGAEPRHLPLPGAELDGIVYLRTIEDSEALGGQLGEGTRVTVVGAGWIGSEVAASARQKGCEVTMIAPEDVPLERVLGKELGTFYLGVHTGEGVNFMAGTGVTGFEGSDRVESVTTDSGEKIGSDLVVVGAGVLPRTSLAEGAGIATDNGILTGADLQTDSPGIYAAGDVANAWHPFYEQRVRVEHWANARRQGAAAGRAMAGDDVSYDEIPYFFSDQYEVGMEYVGFVTESDRIIYRGSVEEREFIAFWMNGDRVVAGMNVNVWDVSDTISDLIRSRTEVDTAKLTDSDVDLASLLTG
mgnify:CR=1 FL=1